ncbi:phage tail protein [Citrobacter freundii]|uniref:phage tail protein n=2 Tax=Citrobacter TaxID=544 RepID=UPI002279F3CA|nr:phage tail protein [Citrobacter freundii]MCY3452258.1 phage tail protein [Citrobacter freundii]
MSAKFYTLLTDIGAAKLASAAALGVPLKITQMAVGDGGGALPTPSAQQTALVAEKRRAALNMLYIDPQNSSQIIAEQVIPETEGGWWIREVGLFDETGALIAVGNCPESYKPQLAEGSGRTQTVRMVLITSSTDNITLKIDPAVVLATRKYVDDKVLELKVYVDELMAKHIAAADPHTQYAPKESPTLTGTPKAPTAPAGTNTTQIASTAFVQAVVTALNNALALKAPLASPDLTGTPTAPTAAQTVNNTQVATTAFVKSAIAALVASSPAALDTLNELAEALGNDPNFATTMTNALAGKQPLDATLTSLSGKSISGILQYLGLGDGTGRLIAVYRVEASRKITLPPGTKFVVADLTGAGGGGGSNSTTVQPGYASSAQGGNSGSRVVAKFDGYEGQEIDVTIGAGGTGGVATPATGADGATGGSTIVGTGIAATGGRGGIRGAAFNVLPTSGPTASPNADNTISNGVELIAQHTGHGGSSGFLFSDKNALGGKGADSEFGTGGVAIAISAGINASGGNNARGNGAGGSGAVSIYGTGSTGVSMPGGTGANGLAILWVYG